MDIEPVIGRAAALVDDALVVADLHVGLEVELARRGVEVPSRAARKERCLLEILDLTGAGRVVLAGDAKHNVPFTSRREATELSCILGSLTSSAEVTLVPGNHDGGIDGYLPPDVELVDPGGVLVGDVGVLHGHCTPSGDVLDAETLLVGHTHPRAVFRESNGASVSRRAWLRFRGEREVVVMPAFEEWGGADVAEEGLLGPLSYPGVPEATLLDGTFLGEMEVGR